MLRSDFQYSLPEELIAQYPPKERGSSRMLVVDQAGRRLIDSHFAELTHWLKPGDLLVFNDTRVIPARLFAAKQSGGRVEVLVERIVTNQVALAHLRCSRSPKPGSRLVLDAGPQVEVLGRSGSLFELRFPEPVIELLQRYGAMPLPPYIQREAQQSDSERYQTVFAKRPGAVAAPTAGLHFDELMLQRLERLGVESQFVTLHVGAGTFQPVRSDDIGDHKMHAEYLEVSAVCVEAINRTRAQGGRVVAVGTTVVRSLESAASSGELLPFSGESTIFIYPGYRFGVIDALLTNFHLPESTLLMLVCALSGYSETMAAYSHAVAQRYRFFSYGDAMLLLPNEQGLSENTV